MPANLPYVSYKEASALGFANLISLLIFFLLYKMHQSLLQLYSCVTNRRNKSIGK